MIKLLDALADHPKRLVWALVIAYVGCSGMYSLIENKGPIEGLWWGLVTATTVGYGDYSPSTTAGRAVGAVLMTSMWALTLLAAGALVERYNRDRWTDSEQKRLFRIVEENNELLKQLLAGRNSDEKEEDCLGDDRRTGIGWPNRLR